jgi:hypothetical protein
MKTNFKTDEDRYWLSKIICCAIAQAESTIYNPFYSSMPEVKNFLLVQFELRAKCFEFLGKSDPNEELNQKLIANIMSGCCDECENWGGE